VRRKADTVLALEAAILSVLVEQAHAGNGSMHGFELARHVRDDEGGPRAHCTALCTRR